MNHAEHKQMHKWYSGAKEEGLIQWNETAKKYYYRIDGEEYILPDRSDYDALLQMINYEAGISWDLGGNTLTATGKFGSLSNHDLEFVRNNVTKLSISSTTTVITNDETYIKKGTNILFGLSSDSFWINNINATNDGVYNRFAIGDGRLDLLKKNSENTAGLNIMTVSESGISLYSVVADTSKSYFTADYNNGISTIDPTTGTTLGNAIKIGSVKSASVSLDTTEYWEVMIGGDIKKIALVTIGI